jgi:hypothetical protein
VIGHTCGHRWRRVHVLRGLRQRVVNVHEVKTGEEFDLFKPSQPKYVLTGLIGLAEIIR